jgi:hypothetical protein
MGSHCYFRDTAYCTQSNSPFQQRPCWSRSNKLIYKRNSRLKHVVRHKSLLKNFSNKLDTLTFRIFWKVLMTHARMKSIFCSPHVTYTQCMVQWMGPCIKNFLKNGPITEQWQQRKSNRNSGTCQGVPRGTKHAKRRRGFSDGQTRDGAPAIPQSERSDEFVKKRPKCDPTQSCQI